KLDAPFSQLGGQLAGERGRRGAEVDDDLARTALSEQTGRVAAFDQCAHHLPGRQGQKNNVGCGSDFRYRGFLDAVCSESIQWGLVEVRRQYGAAGLGGQVAA